MSEHDGKRGETPRVALIGHGYWGKNLARNLHELGLLAVICDSHPETREAVAALYPGVALDASLDATLARDEIDGVVIATPAESHFALAEKAIAAGKDVFVEKPLALHAAQGRRLVAQAEEAGRILMVGHLMEYHPGIQRLSQLVAGGELGQLQYIYSNRLNWGKVRREENILWSFAPHDIALILRLLGELPTEVSAHGAGYLQPDIADVTVTNLAFRSGVRAHIFVSWLHPYKEQRLVVVGDRKVATFDDTANDGKLKLYPHSIEWVDRVPFARKADAEVVPFDDTEPLRLECQAFSEAIVTRTPPITDGASGVRVLEVLERCQVALESGMSPKVAAVAEDGAEDGDAPRVHASAVVDPEAQIGARTRIWHFSHVMKGARLGMDCVLGQNVHVGPGVGIGNRVKIQNNVSVYAGVELEDDVFCGPSMVFTNVRNPRAHVERKDAFESTLVQRGATLGAASVIRCGVTVGTFSLVGAGAVVTKDVPAHAVVVGNPAKQTGWACRCGEVLPMPFPAAVGSRADCARCETTYLRVKDGERGIEPVEVAA